MLLKNYQVNELKEGIKVSSATGYLPDGVYIVIAMQKDAVIRKRILIKN
jgi:hypothetical protein